MMLAMLHAIRANAQATVKMVDTLLASVQETTDKAIESASATPAQCEHPSEARTPIPSMGNPGRYRCTACGAVVEPQRQEGP